MPRKSSSSVKIYYPEYAKEEVIAKIKSGVTKLRSKLPVELVALFGSYAQERHTAASDIDVLVVYTDPKREDDYELVIDTIQLPRLEPHIYTASEYKKMKDSTLRRQVENKGIVIWAKSEAKSH